MSDSSDTEIESSKEILKRYKNNPEVKKYDKFMSSVKFYLKNSGTKSIDDIFDELIQIFFELLLKVDYAKIKEMLNSLSMLCNKFKQMNFFNLLVAYYRLIKKLSEYKKNVMTVKSFYDHDLNANLQDKIFRVKFSAPTPEAFSIIIKKLELHVYSDENPFLTYDLVEGAYPDGYSLFIKLRNSYLILNDESNKKESIQDMKKLFKKYGINENYINWWKNNSYSRQKTIDNEMDFINEEEGWEVKRININNDNDNDNANKTNKHLTEEQKKEKQKQKNLKWNKVTQNLIKSEEHIQKNFKFTKRNFSNFQKAYLNFRNIVLSIDEIKNEIKDIYPYGSVIQLTQNIISDIEISIITKNYQNSEDKGIKKILGIIREYFEKNHSEEYNIPFMRETKRTNLLILYDINLNVHLEVNCNNIFGVLNGNLIRNNLIYDARVLILVNTIKDWSKIKGVNSNHEGFISSYCYTLMTIYFLQRMHNPLLPIISSKKDYNKVIVKGQEYFLEKKLLNVNLKNWHTKNKEDTVSTLLLKFFVFYLYLFPEDDYCIDITNEKLIFRCHEAEYLNYFGGRNKTSTFCIIDMFDHTYNPGSYMNKDSTPHILFRKKIKRSIVQLLNGEENILKPDIQTENEDKEIIDDDE